MTALALQRKEAAAALGVGVDTFDRHIRPNLRCVYVGSVRLWPVSELAAWLDANATGGDDHKPTNSALGDRANGPEGVAQRSRAS